MEELIRKAEEMGINVEDVLIALISKNDPKEEVRLRLEVARKYMAECDKYLKEGDPVQASEKAYKVAEELVKALAEKFNLEEYQKALREGRWYVYSLGSAAAKLSQMLGNWVIDGWDSAYALHVWGFHEAKWTINDILSRVERVRKMLEESEKVLNT